MANEQNQPVSDEDAQPAGSCRFLRSKGMYVTGCMDPVAEGAPMGDGYCWCNQTQNVLGPDDDFVDRSRCSSGRSCFVSLV